MELKETEFSEETRNKLDIKYSLLDILNYKPSVISKNWDYLVNEKEIIFDIKTNHTSILKIDEIKEGKVHYIYKITTDSNHQLILKIRKDHFYSNPNINIDPSHILDEYNAYKLFENFAEWITPKVHHFDDNKNYLLIDHIPEKSLETYIDKVSNEIMTLIADKLWSLHKSIRRTIIRDVNRENKVYLDLLYYRFWFLKNERVAKLLQKLYLSRNGIIHWDLTPNNILTNNKNTLKLIDLETVHYWNQEFDIGFFLAHIFLHHREDMNYIENISEVFLNQYNTHLESDMTTVVKVFICTILYRVHSPFKYWINDSNYIKNFEEVANNILEMETVTFKYLFSKLTEIQW